MAEPPEIPNYSMNPSPDVVRSEGLTLQPCQLPYPEVPCEPREKPLTGEDTERAELPLLKIYYILQALENVSTFSILYIQHRYTTSVLLAALPRTPFPIYLHKHFEDNFKILLKCACVCVCVFLTRIKPNS